MSLTGSFQFFLIPADASRPMEPQTADKAGGLTDDALVKHAKEYFHQLTGAKQRSEAMSKASPAERKALAQQIRNQMSSQAGGSASAGGASRLDELDDEAVLAMVYRNQANPSCDIMAVTVPVQSNNFQAVSMYSADSAKENGLPLNARATALLTACGHSPNNSGGVYGDVFVGRAQDDEAADVWQRVDFTVDDANPAAEWCRIARSPGGGGGSGLSAASSLSGLVQQTGSGGLGGGGGMQVIDASAGQPSLSLYGSNGAPPVQETWGIWTQSDSEVELKFVVPSGTKAKYCKISFARTSVKVVVAGQTLLQGTTFDAIVVDDSTFTLQDVDGGRELCVTLGKTESRTWSWVVSC
jgi:CS domain